MQNPALHIVLDHLDVTFHCDREETCRLLAMLRHTLATATPVLRGTGTDHIYHCSHKLHSELHSCGYERLSDLAMSIELLAKKGIIDRQLIDELLAGSASLCAEIDDWLAYHG